MTRIKQPLMSGRIERSRIVTWLRRRSESAEARAIADEIETGVDVEETQDLRDASDYPTDTDAAFAIGGWATYHGLTGEESAALKRVADRLAYVASEPTYCPHDVMIGGAICDQCAASNPTEKT